MPDSYPAVAILTALASSNVLPSLAALEQSVQSIMGHDECSSDRLNVPSDWSLSMDYLTKFEHYRSLQI